MIKKQKKLVLLNQLQFNAYKIKHDREGWRFFSYALVHAGWAHLAINMFVLWSFGRIVYTLYGYHFGTTGILSASGTVIVWAKVVIDPSNMINNKMDFENGFLFIEC